MPCKKCALNSKSNILKKTKNWPCSNDCLCRLVPFISMNVGTFVKWSFLDISNKSARICLNIFGDSVIQSLKSGKARKSGLIPMSKQGKLTDLFLVFPGVSLVFLH